MAEPGHRTGGGRTHGTSVSPLLTGPTAERSIDVDSVRLDATCKSRLKTMNRLTRGSGNNKQFYPKGHHDSTLTSLSVRTRGLGLADGINISESEIFLL
jgi:hypothetical protein